MFYCSVGKIELAIVRRWSNVLKMYKLTKHIHLKNKMKIAHQISNQCICSVSICDDFESRVTIINYIHISKMLKKIQNKSFKILFVSTMISNSNLVLRNLCFKMS